MTVRTGLITNAWTRWPRFDKQAAEGDVKSERPMWGEKGNIDFDGRESWDHWKLCEGMSSEQAKEEFVRVGAYCV